MQLTTVTLSNSEVQLVLKALELFDCSSLGFEYQVSDIYDKIVRSQKEEADD